MRRPSRRRLLFPRRPRFLLLLQPLLHPLRPLHRCPADPRTALRFELYCEGVELANGFRELRAAAEQRSRFERDNEERRRAGLPVWPPDERLLAALGAGLPECAGVALGFDRTLMLALGAVHIDDVLPFPTGRA